MARGAASTGAMGRFETEMLTRKQNYVPLADLAGRWVDAVHDRRRPKTITFDMDSLEGAWRSGRLGVERALQVELPAPALRVQPVRGYGALCAPPRQCPRRRWLGGHAASGVGKLATLEHPASPSRGQMGNVDSVNPWLAA